MRHATYALLFKDKDGWRVRAQAINGKIGATTEVYTRRRDAVRAWRTWFPYLWLLEHSAPVWRGRRWARLTELFSPQRSLGRTHRGLPRKDRVN